MTQNSSGIYCPRCDTVWAAPGVCRCKDYITYSDSEFPRPTFHCSICGEATEGFSLCLKCNPQTYKIVGIERVLAPSVFEKEIWNEAIEAAAKCVDQANHDGPYNAIVSAREIRKLKK